MGETMDHILVNPNQFHSYGMKVQEKPFAESPIFIATEDHDFILPLSFKGTILGVTTVTPMGKELQKCPRDTCSLTHERDPHNVCFLKISRTVEQDASRKVGAVMTEGGSPDITDTEIDSNSVHQIYDIGAMTS